MKGNNILNKNQEGSLNPFRIYILLFICLFLLCSTSYVKAETTSDIIVSVNVSGTTVTFTATQNGAPVSNVRIYVDSDSKGYTDSNGELSISSADGDHGWYATYGTVSGTVDSGTYSVPDIIVSINISGTTVTFTATQNGAPVSNVRIVVDGSSRGYTDSNGEFSISSADGDHGWYATYGTVSGTVDSGTYSVPDIIVSINISGTTVTFTATQNGAPVSNVRIVVDGSSRGYTDSNGEFSISSADGDHGWYATYGTVSGTVDSGTYSVPDNKPLPDSFYYYPTTAFQGHETELTVIINLIEISMNVGDPVQWYITTPGGETITGESDTLKCCLAGGLYDKAYYNFPEYGTYTIRVEFPGYIEYAEWNVDTYHLFTLSTSISDTFSIDEPVILTTSVINTGSTNANITLEVTSTGGYSSTRTLSVPVDSTSTESFDFGTYDAGTYSTTINMYDGTTLLESDTKSFMVFDSESLKFINRAYDLKTVSINEFDQMAGIVGDDYYSTFLQFSVANIMNILNGPIKSIFFNEEMAGWAGISPDIFKDAFAEQVGFLINASGIWELGESTAKDGLADLARDTYLNDEIQEVTIRQNNFTSYAHLNNFQYTPEMDQRVIMGKTAISEVTESKPLIHIPWVGYDFTVLKIHNTFDFVSSDIGKYISYAIVITAIIIIICTVIGAAVGAGVLSGGTAVPAIIALIVHIGSLAATLIAQLKALKALQMGVLLILCLMLPPATDIVANEVTIQHDQTLDTVEDIIASNAYEVTISDITTSASYIGEPTSATYELDNKEQTSIQPIVEMMLISPDGRIIDIIRQDPYLTPLSTEQQIQSFLPASENGDYTVLGMVHAGYVATSIMQQTMSVEIPNVTIDLFTTGSFFSLGETIDIKANFTNTEPVEINNLTYVIEFMNTSSFDADMITLPPSLSYTKNLSFTPSSEGSYIAKATLLLGFTEVASRSIGFAVGEGEGLLISVTNENLYLPETDVIVPAVVDNIGTVHTDSILNVTTYNQLEDFAQMYTTEIPVSLDASASTSLSLTVLPDVAPGIYRTNILVGDFSAVSFEYTVTAESTIFTILDTDKIYYNLTEPVIINTTVNDILFNATEATVNVTVSDPTGNITYSAVTGSSGHYQSVYYPTINGTYEIMATSSKNSHRTYNDEVSVIVGERSILTTELENINIKYNETSTIELHVINELKNPVGNAIISLNGSGVTTTKITDVKGNVSFTITPNTVGTIQLKIEKCGYATYTSTINIHDASPFSLNGDFSGDGTTNAWDITYLARSIAGILGYEVLSSDDISGDGVVDIWDCTYLARAIAGVPGYNV